MGGCPPCDPFDALPGGHTRKAKPDSGIPPAIAELQRDTV